MTDLKDLMRESAETGSGPAVDPTAVLRDGRRLVRRRRNRGLAALGALLVAGALAAGTGLLPSRVPQPVDRPGELIEVQVPRAEAVDRCRQSVDRQNTLNLRNESLSYAPLKGEGTLADGTRVKQPAEPWFEGTVLYLVETSDPGTAYACMVPQADRVPDAGALPRVPAAPGTAEFRDQCATVAGRDLTGWRYVAGATGQDEAVGLFTSRNGWSLQCRYPVGDPGIDNPRLSVELGGPDAARSGPAAGGLTGNGVWVGCRAYEDEYNVFVGTCYGAGAAVDRGKPVASLRVSMPGGERTVPVHDGWYAFALTAPDGSPLASYQRVAVTTLDAHGKVLGVHPVRQLTPQEPLL